MRATSFAQAGRLSLPACEEEDEGCKIGRKAEGFPQVRRRSRSESPALFDIPLAEV